MKNISTCIWLDNQAEEALTFYETVFENVKRLRSTNYSQASSAMSGRPAGSLMTLEFEIEGQEFMALNGGPIFKPNPSISFYVACKTVPEVDETFRRLSEGGEILMPLDKYPFSEKFGWVNDRFGVSWRVNLAETCLQKITPSLMFCGANEGGAEEAMELYTSIFQNSKVVETRRYEEGQGGTAGRVKHGVFLLNGEQFMAFDSPIAHAFKFNEGVSFIVNCKTQEEINDFWSKLCEGGKPSQCGWLADKFGVAWQIVPTVLVDMLQEKDADRYENVMNALMQMTKLDIDDLKAAYSK